MQSLHLAGQLCVPDWLARSAGPLRKGHRRKQKRRARPEVMVRISGTDLGAPRILGIVRGVAWEPPAPPPKPTPLCSRTERFLCATQTHMVEPTGAPLPPWESRCQQPLSVPGRRLAERGCAGRDRRGRGQGRRLAFLPGTCYFGPTESLFLLGLRSNASDKTPCSDLFT